ncbi:MAG: hypothetical protein QM723_15065 [Myxococcaceae bacterium]
MGQRLPAECTHDFECGLTQIDCCPGCCQVPQGAMPTKDIVRHTVECNNAQCSVPKCSGVCPPYNPPQLHAECLQGRCVAATGPAPECHSDTDCTMSSFAGCCGTCCPEAPHVTSVEKEKMETMRCGVVDCAALACPKTPCPQVKRPAVRPACRAGVCVAEPLGAAECRADGDCELSTPEDAACRSSPCGCCPGSEVARPLGRPHALEEPPPAKPPQTPKKSDPKFGLSTGSSGGAPPPQCSPCPAAKPARAACREGKCIKAPVFMSK